MASIEFTIPGRPTAWQRAVAFNGRKITPKDMREQQARIRGIARLAAERAGVRFPLEGPLRLEVLCVYAIPEGFRGAKREAALEGRVWRPAVPDWDNIGKQISDALNPEPVKRRVRGAPIAAAYRDDSQICLATVAKRYGDPERTVVRLSQLPGWDDPPEARLL